MESLGDLDDRLFNAIHSASVWKLQISFQYIEFIIKVVK